MPLQPCSIIGSEDLPSDRCQALARLFGLPYFPITPLFPLAGPVGRAVPRNGASRSVSRSAPRRLRLHRRRRPDSDVRIDRSGAPERTLADCLPAVITLGEPLFDQSELADVRVLVAESGLSSHVGSAYRCRTSPGPARAIASSLCACGARPGIQGRHVLAPDPVVALDLPSGVGE